MRKAEGSRESRYWPDISRLYAYQTDRTCGTLGYQKCLDIGLKFQGPASVLIQQSTRGLIFDFLLAEIL